MLSGARLVTVITIVASLAVAHALQVQHEDSVSCREFFWDNNPTVLYNLAFAMSRNSVLQDWVFAFESGTMTQTCVNASYTSAFDDPQMLMRIDLGRVTVRKTVCFSGGVLSEKATIAQVPYFGKASVDISAARDPASRTHLRFTATFSVETPWIFKVAEGALAQHVSSYLKRYTALMAKAVCI
jgi:hypothetical protein